MDLAIVPYDVSFYPGVRAICLDSGGDLPSPDDYRPLTWWGQGGGHFVALMDGVVVAEAHAIRQPLCSGKIQACHFYSVRAKHAGAAILGPLVQAIRDSAAMSDIDRHVYTQSVPSQDCVTEEVLAELGFHPACTTKNFLRQRQEVPCLDPDKFRLDIYRGGSPDDEKELAALVTRVNRHSMFTPAPLLDQMFCVGIDRYVRIWDGENLAGTIAAALVAYDDTLCHGHIYSFAVLRRYWGTGAANLLLAEALRSLQEDGADEVGVEVEARNAASLHYERLYNFEHVFNTVTFVMKKKPSENP